MKIPELIHSQYEYIEDKYSTDVADHYEDLMYLVNNENFSKNNLKKVERGVHKYARIPEFQLLKALFLAKGEKYDQVEALRDALTQKYPEQHYGSCVSIPLLLRFEHDTIEKIEEVYGNPVSFTPVSVGQKGEQIEFPVLNLSMRLLISYFIQKDDGASLSSLLRNVGEVLQDYPELVNSYHQFRQKQQMQNLFKKAAERMEKERAIDVVEIEEYERNTEGQEEELLSLNFPQLEVFYEKKGFELTEEEVQDIAQLPKDLLLKGLESMLKDTYLRYNYWMNHLFEEESEDDELDPHAHYPVQVSLWLGEYGGREQLKVVLEALYQGDEINDFWYLGSLEAVWKWPLYRMGKDNIDRLFEYIQQEEANISSRVVVIVVLEQIAVLHPEKKAEVVEGLKKILETIIQRYESKQPLNRLFIESITESALMYQEESLVPFVENIYDKGLRGYTWEEQQEQIDNTIKSGIQKELHFDQGLLDRYADMREKQSDMPQLDESEKSERFLEIEEDIKEQFEFFKESFFGEEEEDDSYEDDFNFEPESDKASIKIGRNDPCPCGSGKKYKKCCGS